jgi:hypothetical protein
MNSCESLEADGKMVGDLIPEWTNPWTLQTPVLMGSKTFTVFTTSTAERTCDDSPGSIFPAICGVNATVPTCYVVNSQHNERVLRCFSFPEKSLNAMKLGLKAGFI